MPDFFKPLLQGPTVSPWEVAIRLLAALLLGAGVAWIYRRTRPDGAPSSPSFSITLVLLSVLIAMVTQVIGDNVARAFSLVGALSIVRFRTVVRDTQDTAYVIFAVVVGMAIGAHNVWVGLIGIVVVGLAAWTMRLRWPGAESEPIYMINVRVALGVDAATLVTATQECLVGTELVSVATAKQGFAKEFTYQTRLSSGKNPDDVLRALNRCEGVQKVEILRRGFGEE